VEKYGTAGQATEDNITLRMRFACWVTKATDTLTLCHLLLLHGSNGYANALQFYVRCTFLLVFLSAVCFDERSEFVALIPVQYELRLILTTSKYDP
jgi:hypothetical protein